MVKRNFWLSLIESSWQDRSIIWLAGVRRVGKTSLCKSLPDIEYYDCDLPRVKQLLADPEQFYKKAGKRIVLDEIHALPNPSIALKIAADHFPDTKVIGTGSSTIGASRKFKDSLTGRKNTIHLTPLLQHEGVLFGNDSIDHRLLYGGLPPFFLSTKLPEKHYSEWFSSYWAGDIQELYKVGSRYSFIKCINLLLAQSGSIFEATRFANECEVSRPTITKYLTIAEETFVVRIVRPFGKDPRSEITTAPKVYGFDTGFVCYSKGWELLRKEYYGDLWEHLVLNNLIGTFQDLSIKYWRDRRGHEIDFVLQKNRNKDPITIECKWHSQHFSPKNLIVFRRKHPHGKNYVVSEDIVDSFDRIYDDITVTFVSLNGLMKELA